MHEEGGGGSLQGPKGGGEYLTRSLLTALKWYQTMLQFQFYSADLNYPDETNKT